MRRKTPGTLFTTFFFVTYEWAQEARVFHNIMQERLARDKYSSLLCPFITNEENEVL
jgi:hypothetical protein